MTASVNHINRITQSLYNFRKLSNKEQHIVVIDLLQINTLRWHANREKYLLALCKRTAGLVNSAEEINLLRDIEKRFSAMTNRSDIDTCYMFWFISGEERYRTYMQKHITSGASLYQEARYIYDNCMNN